MERRDYLELMTGQIRCKKMCPVIVRQVEDQIEDQPAGEVHHVPQPDEEAGDGIGARRQGGRIHRTAAPAMQQVLVTGLQQLMKQMMQYRVKMTIVRLQNLIMS